jgi:signal transduction histidine kinase
MSLTTRLSAFFLGMLALVLIGFSAALYVLARAELYHQLDLQLKATLDMLTAAVEIGAEDGLLEWEPNERPSLPGHEMGDNQVRWTVSGWALSDAAVSLVDHSANFNADRFAHLWPVPRQGADAGPGAGSYGGETWRFLSRPVHATRPSAGPVPAERGPDGQKKYTELLLVAGVAETPVRGTLQNLALTLTGLTVTLWGAAALLGRRLCRRALAPLTHMAAGARAMSAASWDQRLPSPGTKDELEDLGHAFNDLLARLHEAYERQRRFTGDASHQLRTPLAAALGQIEVALRRDRPSEEYRQTLTRVHGQAVHLRQIVEMLLFLARADGEAKLPSLETVDMAAWLEEHLQGWSEHPRASDLQVLPAMGGPFRVQCQPPLLGQLLDNLLDNACKYSRPGTPIRIRLDREPGVIICSVEDQGCGIAEEDLPHVFEPFYRSVQARRQGSAGVGLGLAIAQRIATAFQGTLTVQSVQGLGTQFTLRLPEFVK